MDINSEMQAAELELRTLLEERPSSAMAGIVDAYNRRSPEQREALIAVMAARLAISGRKSASPSA